MATSSYWDARDAALDACVALQHACTTAINRSQARAALAQHVQAAAPVLAEILLPRRTFVIDAAAVMRKRMAMRDADGAESTGKDDDAVELTDEFCVAPPSAMVVLDLLAHAESRDVEVRDVLTAELARWIEVHPEHELWLLALLDADQQCLFDALGPHVTRYSVEAALRSVKAKRLSSASVDVAAAASTFAVSM